MCDLKEEGHQIVMGASGRPWYVLPGATASFRSPLVCLITALPPNNHNHFLQTELAGFRKRFSVGGDNKEHVGLSRVACGDILPETFFT